MPGRYVALLGRWTRFWPVLLFLLVLVALSVSAQEAQRQTQRDARARQGCAVVRVYVRRIELLTKVGRETAHTAALARSQSAIAARLLAEHTPPGPVRRAQLRAAHNNAQASAKYRSEVRELTDLPPLPCG